MVILIFGESCTGKSTIAEAIRERTGAAVYAGKDYLRLAKGENAAREAFRALLARADANAVYVAAEREQLALAPADALRVRVTASLDSIKSRFAARTGGRLPPPVAEMLLRRHGQFDADACDLAIDSDETDARAACERVLALADGR